MLKLLLIAVTLLQAGPTTLFRVSGTVTREDGQTAAPSNQNVVRLAGLTNYGTAVGADGSFQFPRVTPGTYQLTVGPTVTMEPVMISVGDKEVSGIRLVVPRVPVIATARITAAVDGGGPQPRFLVTFTKVDAPAGTIPLMAPIGTGTFSVPVGAGEYRIGATGFPEGYSLKSATVGSTNLLSQTLKIAVGESPQISLVLGVSSPPPWVKVSGRITGARATELGLINPVAGDAQFMAPKSDGTFEFSAVLPGNYDIQASTPVGTVSIRISVSAGKDLTGIELKTPAAKEISGRIVMSGRAIPRVAFSMTNGRRFTATAGPDGTFKLTLPLIESPITFDPNLIPPGLKVKSLTYGTVDLLTNPIKTSETDTAELLLTFDSSGVAPVSVSGRVNGLKSATNAHVFLIANATSESFDAALNPDGTFTFAKIFPGQYQARISLGGTQVSTGVNVGNVNKTDVVLNYARQIQIQGQIVMDDPSLPPPGNVILEARRADGTGNPFTARSTPTGVFRLMTTDGEFTLSLRDIPAGLRVKAFTYGDTDLQKNPLKLDDWPIWQVVVRLARQ